MLNEAYLNHLIKYAGMRTRLRNLAEELRQVGQLGKGTSTEVYSVCHGMAHALNALENDVVNREMKYLVEELKKQALKGNANA
jgi:hypothetical protein